MGFATTFRFGFPFFLEPNVDELLWRTQVKDNFSLITGDHNLKFGGEWLHTLNDQVFRGFFTGRYIFDSPAGFLRYSSAPAANGFGPNVGECFNAAGAFTGWITQGAPFNQKCDDNDILGQSTTSLFAERHTHWNLGCAASGCINHHERRLCFIRSGQVADQIQLHFDLRPALGSSDFPRAGDTTQSNRLCFVAIESGISFRRHVA
jgi:hypothetical protein